MKSTNTFKKVLLVAGGLAILNMVQFPSDTVLDRLQSVVTNQIEVHAEELFTKLERKGRWKLDVQNR